MIQAMKLLSLYQHNHNTSIKFQIWKKWFSFWNQNKPFFVTPSNGSMQKKTYENITLLCSIDFQLILWDTIHFIDSSVSKWPVKYLNLILENKLNAIDWLTTWNSDSQHSAWLAILYRYSQYFNIADTRRFHSYASNEHFEIHFRATITAC